MAVRRVVAAIDVVINGQRNLDRLAQTYATIDRASQAAVRSIRTYQVNVMGAVRASDQFSRAIGLNVQQQTRMAVATANTARTINSFLGATRQAAAGFMGFVGAIQRGRERLDAQGRSTRGLTDNIISLTRSMLLFSVMLPLVQLPQRAIESMSEFVKVGAEWMTQMRAANALLNVSEDNFGAYNRQVQQMAIQHGVATDQMSMFQVAASSVSAITAVNTEKFNALGREAYEASVALDLASASARLARATFTQASESQTVLIQTMATYGLGVEHLTEVSDSLFAVTEVGTVRFNELEHTLPRVTAAMGPLIARATTTEEKFAVMNESFAAFAALTQVMPAEQAATSFANIFKDIAQMTGKQKELVQGWERIRGGIGAGEEAQSLRPEILLRGGPMQALVQLRQVFDLHGKMVDAYVANQRRMGNVADESALRVTGQMQMMQAYFEDMRAVRGFQLASPELFLSAQRQFEADRPGAVGRGTEQAARSLQDAQVRLKAAWTAIQTQLFSTMEQPMIGGLNVITNLFSTMLDNVDFQNGNFLTKLRMVANGLMTSFTDYFRGGGRAQIQTVGRELGTFIGDSITAFFRGGKDNVLIEAGQAFSEAFVEGVSQTLPSLLGAALTSAITRGLATALAIRYMTKGRMPNALSYALTAGGAFGIETARESENPLASLGGGGLGNLLMAGAGAAALGRFWTRRQPVATAGARTAGGVFNNLRNRIMGRAANPMHGPGPFPTGRGWPGFGFIARRGAAGAGGGLLSLAMGIPEILAAENERERWGSIGGTLGGVGGAILGAGAGTLAGGVGGFIGGALGAAGGGALGQWAGGSLYDMLHPATGRGGVAEADAPERAALAETFATGFDASLAVPLLTQIRDILIRSGGGTTGGFSSAAPPVTTGEQVTGRGLEQSFVNQIDTTQLTAAQAQAACGPAAAAFFARAYGRNPTLKEAYALVSRIQGGDPASVGGTRGVATLGTALNQMGIQSEVYQGPNIDWGRLAENAKVGIPGIVNIGPKGNFPGHYFQIGGYNPETGQFNVGASGGVLNAGGNKTMMTAEEMMALGPKQGAIYGLGKTGATGAGNLTEADIAAIPTSAATGMGPGGTGGAVTVNIQNMMNVEHMDGSTDIRSLMGQMAEILRQLSTGGSVVGQSGVVAP